MHFFVTFFWHKWALKLKKTVLLNDQIDQKECWVYSPSLFGGILLVAKR